MSVNSRQSRRISSLLGQRRVSGVAMMAILSAAFVCGLVGFFIRGLWIVSVIVLAMGLGYVVADARRDQREILDRRSDDIESGG
jgi:hypothetical protein